MTAASPPLVNFGWRAADFRLADTKGKVWDPRPAARAEGAAADVHLQSLRVCARGDRQAGASRAGSCTISASAWRRSARTTPRPIPRTATSGWAAFARQHHLPFPYLHDVTQSVARAYGAACTPDFFGFNSDLKLQYRGRLDDSGASPHPGARRELYDAMRQVADTGQGPREQRPAIGCSIKWKAA